MLKRTPLYESHKKLGGKTVDFCGWEMPIQYTSIIDEHTAVREKAGLFDVSHMGEILLKGGSVKEALNRLVTGNIFSLTPKKALYTFLTTETGGVVDDLLVYMINDSEFLLVVNASNTDKDFAWLKEKIAEHSAGIEVTDCSADYVQIALQGPAAQTILKKLTDFDLGQMKFFTFDYVELCGEKVILSRTGYTGEDGFEVLCSPSRAEEIWNSLLEAGKNEGIKPIGLGARDTLRFESALPLYGHELSGDISPIEAGLKFFVKFNKGDYLGKSVLENQVERGTERILAGVEVNRGIPRDGYKVEKDGKEVGYITSGAYSPTFKKGLAMAMLKTDIVQLGNEVDVVIRDKKVKAEIVKLPFYNKKTKSNV